MDRARVGDADKLAESKGLINQIGGFIYDIRHDRPLPNLKAGKYTYFN